MLILQKKKNEQMYDFQKIKIKSIINMINNDIIK